MSVLLISFFALLLIGVPVAAVMGISSMLYLLTRGTDILTIPQRMFAGADSFIYFRSRNYEPLWNYKKNF